MTQTQFDALATLMRVTSGNARLAAWLVLVNGLPQKQASQITGLSQASVSNAVTRFRKARALVAAAHQ